MELAVIDLETTGFSPNNGDRIIEIGIVFLNENLNQLRTFQTLVNPQRRVSRTVHGLTDEDLRDKPTFVDIFDTLVEQLKNTSCLVAHNIAFEKKFLTAEFNQLDFRLPSSLREICTMKAAKSLEIGSNQKLPTLTKELNIEITGPSHRAIPDALATAELLRYLYSAGLILPALQTVTWKDNPVHFPTLTKDAHDRGANEFKKRVSVLVGLNDGEGAADPEPPILAPVDDSDYETERKPAHIIQLEKSASPMINSNISRPVQILISKLLSGDLIAEQAAEALIAQSRRQRARLEEIVELVAPQLQRENYRIRVAVALALGEIGTEIAVKAIVDAFKTSTAEELATECNHGHYSKEPLSEWYAQAIGENETKISAKALIALLMAKSVPDQAKVGVMSKLMYFDLDDLGVRLPKGIVEVLERFASSDDDKLAEAAIGMLGNI